jgi:NADH:ubiquinone oxidoreductase subunit 6 (subunit J)
MILLISISIIAFIFSIFSLTSFFVHTAVYFIILTFLTSGLIYYIVGSTYVSIMLFIVYVGAVAILFIFCVMLLNLQSDVSSIQRIRYYAYIPFFILSIFIAFFVYLFFFQTNTLVFYFDWPTFYYSFYSKDHVFLSSFFTVFSFYIVIIGLILFAVTVFVTALLQKTNHDSPLVKN